MEAAQLPPPVSTLWSSNDRQMWEDALSRYWYYVSPRNRELEIELEALSVEEIERSDSLQWYEFLRDKYFRWKYTAPNRYATTTNKLRSYVDENALAHLDKIRRVLLVDAVQDLRIGLSAAKQIHGLGFAGASGLLALMYPHIYGTVDQFVVKALAQITTLPEASLIQKMRPERLGLNDAVILIRIMQRKAAELNKAFGVSTWTPRKIDKVLWTYGR